MSLATVAQIRNTANRLSSTDEVDDPTIQHRITEAESVIFVDLSSVATEAELTAMGSSSKTLNLLAIYKSCELVLVNLLGYARQADTVSDIQYYEKKYNELIKKILEGKVTLTDNVTTISPKSYPKISSGNQKLYPTKGVSGFPPESESDLEDVVER